MRKQLELSSHAAERLAERCVPVAAARAVLEHGSLVKYASRFGGPRQCYAFEHTVVVATKPDQEQQQLEGSCASDSSSSAGGMQQQRHLRILFAQKPNETLVVTVFDCK